jgi:hypothetical protein
MYIALILLFLLAASVVVGIVRKLRGGQFLPEPEPGEDRVVLDKSGRWWRQGEDGTIEEAFRRPTDARLGIKSILVNTASFYVRLLLWLAVPAAIFGGLWILSTEVEKVGIPGWLPWVMGAVVYLLILNFGRRRGWF